MYAGRNKTARCSQRAFSGALVELMRRKSYADITVSELCQQSGVSRQTFYALFQTKDNVLRFEIMHNYAFPEHLELPAECSVARYIARTFAQYIDSNYDFLKLLMAQNLMQVFYQCLIQQIENRTDLISTLTPGHERFIVLSLSGTACGIVNGCMTEEGQWSAAQLEDIIYQLFSGSFYRKTIPPEFTAQP